MTTARGEEVPLGVECAWPATAVRRAQGLPLRTSPAITVFLLGETVWREARAWLTPALTTRNPSAVPPDRGGERASRG